MICICTCISTPLMVAVAHDQVPVLSGCLVVQQVHEAQGVLQGVQKEVKSC